MSTVYFAASVRILRSTRPPTSVLMSVAKPSMLESGVTSQAVVPAWEFSHATALATGAVHGVAARAGVGMPTRPTKAIAAITTRTTARRSAGRAPADSDGRDSDGTDSGTSR